MLGKFFIFEGMDGSGKSTTMKKVAENLINKGYDVFVTAEPTYSDIGRCFRDLALDNGIDPLTELYLICADRNEHIIKEINPAIEQGKIVLCDRFYPSTLAYQVVDMAYDEDSYICNVKYQKYRDMVLEPIKKVKHGISFIWFDIHFNTYRKRVQKRSDNNLKDIMSETVFWRRQGMYHSLFNPPYRWDSKLYVNSNKLDLNVKKITSFIVDKVEKDRKRQIEKAKYAEEEDYLEI